MTAGPLNAARAETEAAVAHVRSARLVLTNVGAAYAASVRRCLTLTADKHIREQEAIARIMGPEDARNLNPGTGRPHTYSSADDMKGVDKQYRDYLLEVAGAESVKAMQETEVKSAVQGVEFALELLALARLREAGAIKLADSEQQSQQLAVARAALAEVSDITDRLGEG